MQLLLESFELLLACTLDIRAVPVAMFSHNILLTRTSIPYLSPTDHCCRR